MKNLLIITLLVLVSSCGSKKKLTSRDKEIHISSQENDVVLTEKKNIVTNVIKIELNETITYTPIDDTKPIITEDSAGNINKVTNATVVISKSDSEENSSKVDKTETDVKDNSTNEDKSIKNSRSTDSDVKRAMLWPCIIAGLIVAVGGFLFLKKK